MTEVILVILLILLITMGIVAIASNIEEGSDRPEKTYNSCVAEEIRTDYRRFNNGYIDQVKPLNIIQYMCSLEHPDTVNTEVSTTVGLSNSTEIQTDTTTDYGW